MSQSCLQFLFGGQQEVETLRNWSEINNKMEFDININPYELMYVLPSFTKAFYRFLSLSDFF